MKITIGTPLTFYDAFFLLLFGLKVGGVINCSWILVFAPIWIPLCISITSVIVTKIKR